LKKCWIESPEGEKEDVPLKKWVEAKTNIYKSF